MNAGHSVFVLGHGYHSGLAVRAPEVARLAPGAWPALDDFPGADHYELGWGDRQYYPAEHPGPWLAFRALFIPTRSALHVAAIGGALVDFFPDSEIVELRAGRAGFARMVEFVRLTHEFDAQGRALVLGPGTSPRSRFYASARTFHIFENCNVWVARALHAASLPIDPARALTAGALLRQVRRSR